MITKSQVYFANPDAMSGSLVETMRKVKPTIFFGVPRIFEKFEEKIREVIESSMLIKRKIIKWSQKVGQKTVNNKFSDGNPPLFYKIANFFIFSRVREALGFTETRVVASGAAPIKKSTIDFFKSLNIPIFNVYGMSETTGPQCLNLGENKVDLYSSGINLKGTEIKINDPERDGVGEILFRGRNRFMGYFKNESATREAIDTDGYIHSGDMGYINSKGNLVITGRIKEIIVTAGGENIAPIPIEENLKEACKIISNAIVIGDNRPYLVALITIKSDINGNLSEDVAGILNNLNEKNNFSTVIDSISDDNVKNYVQVGVERANSRAISNAQTIKKWTFLPNDFNVETGELTPNHKLKRKFIEQKYVNFIQKLYSLGKF
jgi:long-chain-fatty-acid--CoA ligase ACSBG